VASNRTPHRENAKKDDDYDRGGGDNYIIIIITINEIKIVKAISTYI
jgi:hypothetical protein